MPPSAAATKPKPKPKSKPKKLSPGAAAKRIQATARTAAKTLMELSKRVSKAA